MSRAVVYVRVSTTEQVGNHSLATQERACREYCSHHGLEIAEVFREEGESAKTADRPELQRLINYCALHARKHSITALVVYRIDRLSRAVHDHVMIREQMKVLGIQLYSTLESFDDSPQGVLVEGMMALLAQFENDVRAARTRDGMREAASAGRWIWRPPIGYQRPRPDPLAPSLEPDPERAALITTAFDQMAGGVQSRAGVLARLTRQGLRTKQGKAVPKQTFDRLLKNPLYAGRVVVPRWDLDVQGDFERLVSPDVFEMVQRRLSGAVIPLAPRRRDHPDFPLRRIVVCEHCQTPLTGSWSTGRNKRRYGYYRCMAGGRKHVSVRKEVIEEQLEAHLAGQSVTPGVMTLFHAIVEDAWEQRRSAAIASEDRLATRLDELVAKKDRLVEAFVHEQALDRATYDAHMARAEREIADLRNELAECSANLPDLAATLAFTESLLTDLAGWWGRLDMAGRAGLLHALYPKGLRYGQSGFGTSESPLLMGAQVARDAHELQEVPPAGFEPALPP